MAYKAKSIKILKGLEGVKTRPEMYIGNTKDKSGLHHMLYEVLDNAMDEYLAGHCNNIEIIIYKDNSASVQDNGRGIPTDIHPEENVSAAEVILTCLHAGGKFDNKSYKVSGGLHGVGVSVVNALSDYLEITIHKDKEIHYMKFLEGCRERPLEKIGTCNKKGTFIKFKPSLKVFSSDDFCYSTLCKRFRELAFLNSKINISFEDQRSDQKEIFKYEGGLNSFLDYVKKQDEYIINDKIYLHIEDNDTSVEICMSWTNSYKENILCFTNMIPQKEGGSHLSGFKTALTKSINSYLEQEKIKNKSIISGEDIREGIVCIISVKTPDPRFSSQTKDKLVSNEVKSIIEKNLYPKLQEWIESNPDESKKILKKIQDSANAREAARKAKEESRKKSSLENFALPGKLSDCASKNPEEKELFILEGNSAGGSAKNCRNKIYQAVLPLKGKIINVERSTLSKILGYEGIKHIIAAIGTNIGDNFNINKIRYKKIIIMTDADVDGSHIRVLLLTFFYRFMPEIIKEGYLYIAQPPLYGIRKSDKSVYLKDDKELNSYIIKEAVKKYTFIKDESELSEKESSKLIKDCFKFKNICYEWGSHFNNSFFLENALLSKCIEKNTTQINIKKLLHRLNLFENTYIEEEDAICKVKNNIKNKYILSKNIFKYTENLFSWNEDLINTFNKKIKIKSKKAEKEIHSPITLIEEIVKDVFNNSFLQRYKGVGEMPVDDLFQTTFDPKNRSLLKVTIECEEKLDKTCDVLMGDNVEPRKEYIINNALNIRNLDV